MSTAHYININIVIEKDEKTNDQMKVLSLLSEPIRNVITPNYDLDLENYKKEIEEGPYVAIIESQAFKDLTEEEEMGYINETDMPEHSNRNLEQPYIQDRVFDDTKDETGVGIANVSIQIPLMSKHKDKLDHFVNQFIEVSKQLFESRLHHIIVLESDEYHSIEDAKITLRYHSDPI